MQFLRNILDNIEPKVKGNKFLHTVFDGFDTFLFAPKTVTKGPGVHIRDGVDLKRTMVMVVLALQACLLFGMWNIGHQHYTAFNLYSGTGDALFTKFLYGFLQMLPIIIVANVVGLGIEFIFAAKKGHPIEEGYLVSGMLIPLIMPPDIPLWMLAISIIFAVVIAKEAFGGTGMNILNIALTARVFLFFAYPTEISGDLCWVAFDYNILHSIFGMEGATLQALGMSAVPAEGWRSLMVDGFSGATPLGLAAAGGWDAVTQATLPNGAAQYSISNLFFGIIPGSIGETCKPAILFGMAMLIAIGVASWRIMLSMLMGAIAMGLLFNVLGGNPFLEVPFYHHLIMGSFLFAMVYMATDPVTAAQSNTGKWIYGFGIGAVGMIVRVLNPAYPEGWMLAILLLNVFAPTIDHFIYQRNIKRRLSRA